MANMERWRVNLYTLWLSQVFCLMGWGFAIPFVPFLLQEMGVVEPARLSYLVGMAFTIPAAAMVVASPIWGVLSDRFGRRPMILRSLISGAILLVLMGLCREVWQFMVLRALQGIMTGSVTAAMSFVSANTPENRMSYALGLMTSSTFMGYSIGPFAGGLLAEWLGYRSSFMLGGLIILGAFIIVVVLLKEDPNSYGYQIKETKENRLQGEERSPFRRVLTPFTLLVIAALFFQKMARMIFMPFIALYAMQALPNSGAAAYTGMLNGSTMLATAIAAVTIVRLGDRHEKTGMVILLGVLALPFTIFMALMPSNRLIGFLILFTAYYFVAGSTEPILSSAASERTPPAIRGTLFGLLGTVHSAAAMAGPLLGSFLSAEFGLRMVLACIPIFTVIQIVFAIFLRRYPPMEKPGWEGAGIRTTEGNRVEK